MNRTQAHLRGVEGRAAATADLLVGFEIADDAAVYRLTDELAVTAKARSALPKSRDFR